MRKYGTPELPAKPAVADRFWEKVDKSGDCWKWTGAQGGWGYGNFNVGNRKYMPAHRFAYIETYGQIPTEVQVDHRCRNRMCVNPSHLRAATCKQNIENHGGASRNSQSGVRGVSWSPSRGKWLAQVCHNGERFSKRFDSVEAAEEWVVTMRNQLHSFNDQDRKSA